MTSPTPRGPMMISPVASEKEPREKQKIIDDLALVSNRRKECRQSIRSEARYIPPAEFNKLTNQIASDSGAIDAFLGELFEVMCWENPELLKR